MPGRLPDGMLPGIRENVSNVMPKNLSERMPGRIPDGMQNRIDAR